MVSHQIKSLALFILLLQENRTMAHYTGTSHDSFRILQLTKQREEALQTSRLQSRGSDPPLASKVSTLADKFSKEEDLTFSTIKGKTYGIHELSEYQEKVREAKLGVELESRKREESLVDKKSQQVKKRARPQLLSFGDDDDDDNDDDDDGVDSERVVGVREGTRLEKKRKVIGKNPEVDTTFLPDTERERELQETTRKLAKQWEEEQEGIKRMNMSYLIYFSKQCSAGMFRLSRSFFFPQLAEESFIITYSYWDGRGHRRSTEVHILFPRNTLMYICRNHIDAYS
jgi:protein FAM50